MFGYTPPLVILVDPALLGHMSGFQRVALALEQELARRPVWILLSSADALAAEPDLRVVRDWIEARLTDPRIPLHAWEPTRYGDGTWTERATARALQAHLDDMDIHLPEVILDDRPLPRHPAAIVPLRLRRDGPQRLCRTGDDPLVAAVAVARDLQAPHLQVWRPADADTPLDPAVLDQAHLDGIDVECRTPSLTEALIAP